MLRVVFVLRSTEVYPALLRFVECCLRSERCCWGSSTVPGRVFTLRATPTRASPSFTVHDHVCVFTCLRLRGWQFRFPVQIPKLSICHVYITATTNTAATATTTTTTTAHSHTHTHTSPPPPTTAATTTTTARQPSSQATQAAIQPARLAARERERATEGGKKERKRERERQIDLNNIS